MFVSLFVSWDARSWESNGLTWCLHALRPPCEAQAPGETLEGGMLCVQKGDRKKSQCSEYGGEGRECMHVCCVLDVHEMPSWNWVL